MAANWIGCVIAYNEEGLLPACLESLRYDVDELVVVEGRIADFPGDSPTSDDNTVAVAREFGARVIQPGLHAWPTEQVMRSQYLVGTVGDWYIILDADEILITPLPHPSTLTENVYRIPLRMQGTKDDRPIRRVYKHTGHMQYLNAHDALYSNGTLVSNGDETVLHHVQLYHQQPRRSKERRALKRIKRTRTVAREKTFRESLRGKVHASK